MHDHEGCGCGCGSHGDLQTSIEPGLDWSKLPDREKVCFCSGVRKGEILEAIAKGAYTIPLIKVMTGAGREEDCKNKNPRGRSCLGDIEELIRIYYDGPPPMNQGGCGC